MLHVGLCIAALFVVSITHWVYRWRNPKCNGKLPPGSMGLPLLGETLDFFTPNQTNDTPFIKNRIKRYGPIFRTSLVGLQVIVSTDSELSYMVFQQEGQSFESWYPPSFRRIFGNQNISSLHGSLHKYLKNMVLSVVGPESLKKMFSEVESVATRNLEVWASQETVELKTSIGNMVFEFMGKKLISYDPEKSSENLRDNFEAFIRGLISFPLEIPGTAYYKCLQGRKKMIMKLKNMLEERRAKPNKEEHQKILRKRENPKAGLTWEEYKSMRFTFQVINETLRLASIVPVLFRKAKKDIKFKEYTIPSGWAVMVCPPAVHLDPVNYKDPLDFNPWRWEDMDLKSASKTFMAFGGGQRFCVGADFAKLQIAIFLHCLVTKYQWQPIKGGDIVRTPGLQFPNGFHVRIFEKET
ncbi:putative abieta-7,13-dien-18-ol hydroxylase [Helianthus annuus]|nr:putative abieta-7,13-dien-18-ol hydroxylase [Helianthus annuus]KAJ0609489.1 putative abieta-7,13-dien-18-ol hydroxylase [Helianthus annuus]